MAEINIVQDLKYSRKRLPSIVEFHQSLRRFGMKANSLIDDTKYYVPKEFVAAAIVSYSEIENANTGIIDRAEETLFDFEMRNKKVEVLDFHLSFDRLVLLFTSKQEEPLLTHGAAKLLDYDGKIRQKICSPKLFKKPKREKTINFLQTLKKQFYESFSKEDKYVILIFSHYIPCTNPNDMCSRLLYEFAEKEKEQLIVSYYAVLESTHPKIAWQDMRNSPYIYCIHPRDVRFCPKPLLPPNIKEEIESQLDEDEKYHSINHHYTRIHRRLSKLALKFEKSEMRSQKKGDRHQYA